MRNYQETDNSLMELFLTEEAIIRMAIKDIEQQVYEESIKFRSKIPKSIEEYAIYIGINSQI